MNNAWKRTASYVKGRSASAVVAAVLAGIVFVTGGVALATRSASNQFANAAFSKLGGGDPNAVLDKLADRVVKKLSANNGPLGSAKSELVAKISKAATAKIGTFNTSSLMTAGLDKIDGIDVNAVIGQVTDALIAQAQAEIKKLDLQALAKNALDGVIAKVDIEKLIKEKLDSIDVDKLVSDAIAKQMGGGSGGLLGMLFKK